MDKEFLLEAHRSVNGLLQKLALGMNRKVLNEKIIELTEQLFGQRKASILMLNSETLTLHLEHAPSFPKFYNDKVEGFPAAIGSGSCGESAITKKPVIVSDIAEHPNWVSLKDLAKEADLAACWSVPIISSKGEVLGTFAIYSSYVSVPHLFEVEILELLASLYSVALEKYELENQLNFYANSDALTRCLNRRALLEEAEKVLTKRCFADKVMGCLFVDIDKFKSINDTFGHKFGDEVLVTVANTLADNSSACAKIGRYGGDEFVVFSCYDSHEAAYASYDKLQANLMDSLHLNGMQLSASVGVACQSTDVNLDHLITLADKNMYQIKQSKSH